MINRIRIDWKQIRDPMFESHLLIEESNLVLFCLHGVTECNLNFSMQKIVLYGIGRQQVKLYLDDLFNPYLTLRFIL